MNPPVHKPDSTLFSKTQYAFAAHIRNPEKHPLPSDIEDRRMSIYRDLFYNNVENFIASGFPVLRSITSDDNWHAMVRDFFSSHRCHTPYFLEISSEFLDYLDNERDTSGDPLFIKELAHYEWVELALSVSEESIDADAYNTREAYLDTPARLSPLAWLLSYEFDVHRIGLEYQPDSTPEQITTLIVYRDRLDEVGFIEINPLTAHLIQSLQLNPDLTGRELLTDIANAMPQIDPDVLFNGGVDIINQLSDADILLTK